MSPQHVFISYSSKDVEYVREIMAGLKSQDIDFWDYSSQIQKIEAGKSIPENLKAEIDKCQLFIAIISKHSLHPTIGRFTHMEVEYAVELEMLYLNKIVPMLLKPNYSANLKWPGVYSELKSVAHLTIDPRNTPNFEETLGNICRKLGKRYIPLIEPHPRLPFYKLFRQEVFGLAHQPTVHIGLMTILTLFNKAFQASQFDQAHFLITLFINRCRYELTDYSVFYPWLVKAVTEMELNRLNDAVESCLEAKKVRPNDESVYGCFGQISMLKGNYLDAKAHFEKALRVCPSDRNSDEKINYFSSLLLLGETIPADLDDFLFQLDPNKFGENRFKIMNLQGICLYNLGDYCGAIKIFEKMQEDEIWDTTSVAFHVQALISISKPDEAHKILREAAAKEYEDKRLDRIQINVYLAQYYLGCGKHMEMTKVIDKVLMSPESRTRKLMVSCAKLLLKAGQKTRARKVCREILNGKLFNLPESQEDFYYDGFAQYILGNIERAQYDFERSQSFDSFYSEHEC